MASGNSGYRRRAFWSAVLIAVLTGTIAVSQAAERDNPSKAGQATARKTTEDYTEKRNRQNLVGWKGILFHCTNSGGTEAANDDICARTYTNAAFLAESAKVNLNIVKDSYGLTFAALSEDWLVMEVEVFSTKGSSPSAMHVSVSVYATYKDVSGPWGAGARELIRTGDLLFWHKEAIGASASGADLLVPSMSSAIEQHMKQFLTEYMKAVR